MLGLEHMDSFIEIQNKSQEINSRLISLVRLMLLKHLASVYPDGILFRDLKSALNISEGTLFANLKTLLEMGLIKKENANFEGRELEFFTITEDGLSAWDQIKEWMRLIIGD